MKPPILTPRPRPKTENPRRIRAAESGQDRTATLIQTFTPNARLWLAAIRDDS